MKKYILISLLLFLSSNAVFAQNDTLSTQKLKKEVAQLKTQVQSLKNKTVSKNQFSNRIDDLNKQIKQLKKEQKDHKNRIYDLNGQINRLKSQDDKLNSNIKELSSSLSKTNSNIDSVKAQSKQNAQNIQTIADDLGSKIDQTKLTTQKSVSKLDESLDKNRLYWLVVTLVIILAGVILFWLFGKRIRNNKTDVETQIKNTKASLEEESVKLDNKLIEVLETQLKIQQAEKETTPVKSNDETDHSLALKVADEIVRMQKNISRMDEKTKGLKPLKKGIERIQNNFAANGYEMINLLNTDYDERMNIDVINFKEDESLDNGTKIITKVIKPQVNYNGVMIQRAQVDVSQN